MTTSIPIFIENTINGAFYPNSENIPFSFLPWVEKSKLSHNVWINKNNNPLRSQYYRAFEYYFKRDVQTIEQANEIIQKLYQLIEIEQINFEELSWVVYNKLSYIKQDRSNHTSTDNPSIVKFYQFDIENIKSIVNPEIAKNLINTNNSNVNQLFAYDYDKQLMYPNLKCKSWV